MKLELLLFFARAAGVVFLYAGISKVVFRKSLETTVNALPFIPVKAKLLVIGMLPWVELIIGFLLILGAFLDYVAWASLVILFAFTIVGFVAIVNDLNVPCSCFGTASQESISIKLLYRNTVIAMLILPILITNQAPIFSFDSIVMESNGTIQEVVMLLFITLVLVGLTIMIAVAQNTLIKITSNFKEGPL